MPSPTEPLIDREREILAFERSWWKYAGAKESEVLARFGVTYGRYHQILDALLDRPAALEHDPALVRRLRSLREARAAQRRRRAS